MSDWRLIVGIAAIVYFLIAAYGFFTGWHGCQLEGGEYMRTIIGNWRCIT